MPREGSDGPDLRCAARPAHGQKSKANKVIDGPRPTVDFPSEHPVLLPV